MLGLARSTVDAEIGAACRHAPHLHVAQALLRAQELAGRAAICARRARGRRQLCAALLQRRQRGLARLGRLALLPALFGFWTGSRVRDSQRLGRPRSCQHRPR